MNENIGQKEPLELRNTIKEEKPLMPVLYEQKPEFSLQPRDLKEAMEFAEMMAKSDMVPKDYKGKPANVLIAVQMGAEVGLKAMASIQNIAVINGRPCIWGDAALAIVRNHPAFEYIVEDDMKDIAESGESVCIIKRRGEPVVTRTFTLEDAKKAKLTGKDGTWQSYPSRMLQMRSRGFALRDVFPDALKGLAIREEMQDVKPAHQPLADVTEKPKAPGSVEEFESASNAFNEGYKKAAVEDEINRKNKIQADAKKAKRTDKNGTFDRISDNQIETLRGLIADYDISDGDVRIELDKIGARMLSDIHPSQLTPFKNALNKIWKGKDAANQKK